MAPGNRNNPKRAVTSESTYTVLDFIRDFPDDATCLDYLWRRHYALADGERAHCPKCEEIRKFHRVASRPSYSCDSCGHHIHPTAGTIMHKSSTSLQLWFHAIFLMAQTKCGISAKQLERELGVTYKTAWRMFTKIRNELMDQDDDTLSGEVEMDETYLGGKPRLSDKVGFSKGSGSVQSNAVKWAHETKTPVFGMVERKGKIAAYVVPQRPQAAIMAHVESQVDASAVVYTDESRLYDRVESTGRDHQTIDHSAKIYVSGNVHTQTIDGFWMLLKTGILGAHHSVSPKWLQGYLNEYVWRYNRRDDGHPMFLSLLEQIRPVA